MAEETSTIIRSSGGRARVCIDRTEKYAGCHGCLLSNGKDHLVVTVSDPVGAAPGDVVVIDTTRGSSAKRGFILYILPLMSLVLGYVVGSKTAALLGGPADSVPHEGWWILSGFLFMALTYLLIYLIQKRYFRKHSPPMRVVRIPACLGDTPSRGMRGGARLHLNAEVGTRSH